MKLRLWFQRTRNNLVIAWHVGQALLNGRKHDWYATALHLNHAADVKFGQDTADAYQKALADELDAAALALQDVAKGLRA